MSDLMQSPAVEAEREKYEPMTPKEQLDAALEAYGMDYYLRRVDPDAGDHAYHLAGAKAAVLAAHTACLADGEGLDFVGAVMAAVACQGEDEGDRVFQSDLNAQHGAIVGALKARIQALEKAELHLQRIQQTLGQCASCGGEGGHGTPGFDQNGECWMHEMCSDCNGTGLNLKETK